MTNAFSCMSINKKHIPQQLLTKNTKTKQKQSVHNIITFKIINEIEKTMPYFLLPGLTAIVPSLHIEQHSSL
jgi:hypothetical protein